MGYRRRADQKVYLIRFCSTNHINQIPGCSTTDNGIVNDDNGPPLQYTFYRIVFRTHLLFPGFLSGGYKGTTHIMVPDKPNIILTVKTQLLILMGASDSSSTTPAADRDDAMLFFYTTVCSNSAQA